MIEDFNSLLRKQFSIFANCFLCFFTVYSIKAQNDIDLNQIKVDSLKQEYTLLNDIKDQRRILMKIVQDETDPEEKIIYARYLIEATEFDASQNLLKQDSLLYFRSTAFLQQGNALQLLGEFHEAIAAYNECISLAKMDDGNSLAGATLVSIADTYSMLENSEMAEKYYNEAITLLRKVNDTVSLASALLNAGDEYFLTGQYQKALENFNESGNLFEILDYPIGLAYNKGNTGMVYAKLGNHNLAETNINEAIQILEEYEDYYPVSIFLNSMSEIYEEQNKNKKAIDYAKRSLELSNNYGLKDQISDANLQLSDLYNRLGDSERALDYYKSHIVYRDSVINLENVEKSMNFEVSKRELEAENARNEAEKNRLEVENLEQKRKNQRIVIWSTVGLTFLIGLLAYGLFRRNKFVRATNKIIAYEKDRSDKLLLNILPEDTAQELKDKGKVAAKKFPSTTVLFSDFVGFTSYAENLSPEKLVTTIDHYFSEFDKIMDKYNLEKIKTIGDAYMAVGGLSVDNVDQAKEVILAAKEMVDYVSKAKNNDLNDATFDIRIGINTGPVVAGVVGFKKFAYDIWGDTVNVASRMESNSEPGRINISEDTYEIIKNNFECRYRGELKVKNRGAMKMYFII